jgi:hypothetical protein
MWVGHIAKRTVLCWGAPIFKRVKEHSQNSRPQIRYKKQVRAVEPQMLGTTVQNSLTLATWLMGFVHPLVLPWRRGNSECLFGFRWAWRCTVSFADGLYRLGLVCHKIYWQSDSASLLRSRHHGGGTFLRCVVTGGWYVFRGATPIF